MTYIDYIKQFWAMDEIERFSGSQTKLYFWLLERFNKSKWPSSVSIPNKLIYASIGITENTFLNARNVLKQKGLIDFTVGKNKKDCHKYSIKNCSNVCSYLCGNVCGNVCGENEEKDDSTSNVLYNKTKTKTKTKNIIQESAADAAAQNKIDVRVNKFYDSLVPFLGTYDKKMLRNFFDYWSEPNRNNTKMKWELERTWKTDLRLKNWKNREETRGTKVIKNRNSWTNYEDNNKHFEKF